MRTGVFLLLTALPLGGCFGGNLFGGTTEGADGRSDWSISDGLCFEGLLGGACDLAQTIAVGASPMVQISTRNQAAISGARLVASGGAAIAPLAPTLENHDMTLIAHVTAMQAEPAQLIVQDAAGHEFDRVDLKIAHVASLACGLVRPHDRRRLDFPDLQPMVPIALTASAARNLLGCRAVDAKGDALLTVEAIQWDVETPTDGSVTIVSDDLAGTTPATGGTAVVHAVGSGSAVVRATLDGVDQRIAFSYR
jgi:hypothetical protein